MTLLGRPNVIDGIWIAALIGWFVSSCFFWWSGNQDIFQRLGSVLVAVVGVYYAAVPQVRPFELSEIERDKLATKSTKLIGDKTALAHERTSVLAAIFAKYLEEKSEEVPDAVRTLAAPVLNKDYRPVDLNDRASLDAKADEIAQSRIAAGANVEKINSNRNRMQAATLAIGTIQWGFGDLIVGGFGT